MRGLEEARSDLDQSQRRQIFAYITISSQHSMVQRIIRYGGVMLKVI
jgi:hypothetical protein